MLLAASAMELLLPSAMMSGRLGHPPQRLVIGNVAVST